ncbi:hypothetical protein SVAN01_10206 [Stagonosporopsis vannaccii]|nr:hypothetical protein SVAN01_10206 [Stagonosporopsis vannaccii]
MTIHHPSQKSHEYRLPTPGWVPLNSSHPTDESLSRPVLLQSKTAGGKVRGGARMPSIKQQLRSDHRVVGQLRRASVLPHHTMMFTKPKCQALLGRNPQAPKRSSSF